MIKITGIKETLDNVKKQSKKKVENDKQSLLKQITEDLRNATPVDTGLARESWSFTKDSIENSVDYILNLNRGSSKQAPSNFIESTVLARKEVSPGGIIVRNK